MALQTRPLSLDTQPMSLDTQPMTLDTQPLRLDGQARREPPRPAGLASAAVVTPRRSLAPPGASAAAPARPAAPAQGPSWIVDAGPGRQVMLLPGQMSFTTAPAQLRTLLGSCVSVTLWHPGKRIGGMCHYLLPTAQPQAGEPLDGRYGDEAMEAMVARLLRTGTEPSEYHRPPVRRRRHHARRQRREVQRRRTQHRTGLEADRPATASSSKASTWARTCPRTVSIDMATGAVDMRRSTGRPGGLP
jgi:hypothetical protein